MAGDERPTGQIPFTKAITLDDLKNAGGYTPQEIPDGLGAPPYRTTMGSRGAEDIDEQNEKET